MRLSADIYEEDGVLVVTVALPGNRPNEIELLVDATLLCIQMQCGEGTRESARVSSRRGKRLCGYVPLPVRVLPGDVRANLREGLLEVRLSIEKEAAGVAHYDLAIGGPKSGCGGGAGSLRRRGREAP